MIASVAKLDPFTSCRLVPLPLRLAGRAAAQQRGGTPTGAY
jgi:hypothetical protein